MTHFPNLPTKELDFLMKMFDMDCKNYHVWSYRHWLVRHFQLWDDPREMTDINALLDADVRNNSAWNHRFVLRFGPRGSTPDAGMPNGQVKASSSSAATSTEKGKLSIVDEDIIDSELEYVKDKILIAPENRSPWAYARGVFRASGRSLSEWLDFATGFLTSSSSSSDPSDVEVKSSHALEWLADVYIEKIKNDVYENRGKAVHMFTLLKERYDPIRKNYWDYRIGLLA